MWDYLKLAGLGLKIRGLGRDDLREFMRLMLINVADGFSNLIALHSVLDGRSASVSLFTDINGGGTSLGGFDIAALDQSGCDVGFVCAWSRLKNT